MTVQELFESLQRILQSGKMPGNTKVILDVDARRGLHRLGVDDGDRLILMADVPGSISNEPATLIGSFQPGSGVRVRVREKGPFKGLYGEVRKCCTSTGRYTVYLEGLPEANYPVLFRSRDLVPTEGLVLDPQK